MENKQCPPRWEVDFSNPNANNITTGTTTGKPMKNKQTAVEWLVDNIWWGEPTLHQKVLIEQAKKMEEEQRDLLLNCKLQLEYLNEKFGETGTTNALLSKLKNY